MSSRVSTHAPNCAASKAARGGALVARGAVNVKNVNEERGSAEPQTDKENQIKLD